MWVRLVTSSLLISHDRSLRLPGNRTVRSTEDSTKWKRRSSGCIERTSASTISHLPLFVVLLNGQEYVSMQVSQPISIEREPSLIFLLVFPQYFPISPHTLLLPPSCHPWRVRHTPALGFTTPVCLRHTIFLPPPSPPAPTLAHVWGRSGGTRARNSLKLGNRGAALWPHNDKMVYNILVHYKPFYGGQYRDKVLTKVV